MNEVEVQRQIDQMVRFIKQEAEEKANEISVSAEEEFNISKLQLLDAEKAKIRKEYERREGQVEVKKKIEASKQLNESRLRVLQAREDALQQVLKEAHHTLLNTAGNKKQYKDLLTDLLAQGLWKLSEPAVLVRVREADVAVAKEVFEPARKKYAQLSGRDAPSVALDTQHYLAPPPSDTDDDEFASCAGGLVVTSADGRIAVGNTLDDRLRIAYAQTLPEVRATLFGAEAPVRN